MPSTAFEADSLSRSVKFFPLVGLVVGSGAVLLQRLLMPHLGRPVIALIVLTYLVLITGCLHEDGLADTADAFGAGWTKDQVLLILKDSRIGSYGATALALSLLARYLLLASLPVEHFAAYVISAHVLCRWSSLPLSYFLPPAREEDGQGARIAKLTSLSSLVFGSFFSVACSCFCAALVGCGSAAGGDFSRRFKRLALLQKDWRSDRRLLRRNEPIDRNRRLPLWSVDRMSELLFIRHAETDMAGTFCGHSDPELNARGRAQLAELIHRMSAENIGVVYSSDLRRAFATGSAIAAAFGIDCHVRPALREINFGQWEGLTWKEIERRDETYARRWIAEYPRPADTGR